MQKRLAVIMSVYNNDRITFFKEAVESVLNQTCDDFDFYIIYDGKISADINEYLVKRKDSRLKIFKNNDNYGLAVSLNTLLRILLTKDYQYIARMDADDISMPDRFKRQVDFLSGNIAIDCVGTWAIEIDENGAEYYKKRMPDTHKECIQMFAKRDCMIHPTVMFRRSYFEKAGLYPEDTYFGEDTMMWANGFANGCVFANIPEYLLKFRLDKNFFNRRRGWKHAKSIWTLRRRVNKMLGFNYKADIYALFYALAKMMPTAILKIIYKTAR